MDPREKMDEVYRLNAKRNKLTLINIIGIVVILGVQLIIISLVQSEYMIFYPLLMLAWGIFFVTAITRVNLKQRRIIREISDHVRERQSPDHQRQCVPQDSPVLGGIRPTDEGNNSPQ